MLSQVHDDDSDSDSQPGAGTNLNYYYVRYTAAQGSASSPEDVSAQDKNALDYGLQTSLEDTTTCHIASSEDCTCQMRSHLGLPCRHTQRVWLQENLTQVPDAAVDARWLRGDDDSNDFRALELLREGACTRALAHPSSTRSLSTVDERCSHLSGLAKLMVEVGSLTPALSKECESRMRTFVEQAKSGSLGTRRARQAQAAAAATPSQLEAGDQAESAERVARPATLNPLAKGKGAVDGDGGTKRKKSLAERAKAPAIKKAQAAASAAKKAATAATPKPTKRKRPSE